MEKLILLRHINFYAEKTKTKGKCLLCKCNIKSSNNKKQLYCYGCKSTKRK